MANESSTEWIELIQPLAVCQRSLLATLQVNVEKFEKLLDEIPDDAQLANIDLQNVLQKQSQVMHTTNIVSKLLQDTVLEAIRKIG